MGLGFVSRTFSTSGGVLRLALLVLFLFITTLSPLRAQPDAADARTLMQTGNDAYTRGDFAGAITLYEQVIILGVRDAAVHFNLANAYFEADNLAAALVHYHRARLLDPRDVTLRVHLERARQMSPTGGAAWSHFPVNLADVTDSLVTLPELARIVLALWGGWCLLLAGLLVDAKRRDRWRVPVVMLLIPLVIGLAALGSRVYVTTQQPLAVVMAAGRAMSGPGDDYLTLFEIETASEVRLLAVQGVWGRVLLPGGRQGWLPLAIIELVQVVGR